MVPVEVEPVTVVSMQNVLLTTAPLSATAPLGLSSLLLLSSP